MLVCEGVNYITGLLILMEVMEDLVPAEDLVLLVVIMPHGVVEVIKALVHTLALLVLLEEQEVEVELNFLLLIV